MVNEMAEGGHLLACHCTRVENLPLISVVFYPVLADVLLNGPNVIRSFYLYLVDGYNAANRFHVLTDVIPNAPHLRCYKMFAESVLTHLF